MEANIYGSSYDFGYTSSISGPAVGYDHNDASGATFTAAVPEPASMVVVASGLISLGVIRRRQRRLAQARV